MTRAERRHAGLNLSAHGPHGEEQAEALMFGFWIFLMSDMILFSLLFATYAAMSQHGIAGGLGPAELFSLRNPLLETLALLASSFTIGLAALRLKYQPNARATAFWIVVTCALGAVFIALEVQDFYDIAVTKGAPPQLSGYLSAFFLLVATHGLHVSAGIVWMMILLVQIAVFGLSADVKLRILRLALFWHMLDIVWVGIFTFVFLYGVSS